MIKLWLPEFPNGWFCSEVSGQTKINHTGSKIFHRAADNALAGLFCLLSDPCQTAPCPSLLLICLLVLLCPIFFRCERTPAVSFSRFQSMDPLLTCLLASDLDAVACWIDCVNLELSWSWFNSRNVLVRPGFIPNDMENSHRVSKLQ